MRYLLVRLGFYALAAWVSITLNFFLPRMMPGDAATAMFGRFQGKMSPEALSALKEAFGFTGAPLIEQYGTYLAHLFRGDLGISVSNFIYIYVCSCINKNAYNDDLISNHI